MSTDDPFAPFVPNDSPFGQVGAWFCAVDGSPLDSVRADRAELAADLDLLETQQAQFRADIGEDEPPR